MGITSGFTRDRSYLAACELRRKEIGMELQRFFIAMIAPVGITLMGLVLGTGEMFVAGLIFTGLIVVAGILHWKMSRW